MNKQEFAEKCQRAAEARKSNFQKAHQELLTKQEANSLTEPDSPYRQFEIEFGSQRFKEVNDFLCLLDKSEFDDFLIDDPMLLLCQKFLDWKIEVGEDRLWHEFNIRYDGGEYAENNEGSLFVIKKAWEQVRKEQEIIESARMAYSKQINEMREANPQQYSGNTATGMDAWFALCDGFNKYEALREYNYPLPFNTVFGEYTPRTFYYGKQDNSKLFGTAGE
ncbi:MAG: hypothetical protein EKK54_06125 [Neisseriaceae bacterium]|nr:MAG: hypothetical protein EKK54_06125 [Neisseriaceae bacterium]